mgnify:CR=1 FL=1
MFVENRPRKNMPTLQWFVSHLQVHHLALMMNSRSLVARLPLSHPLHSMTKVILMSQYQMNSFQKVKNVSRFHRLRNYKLMNPFFAKYLSMVNSRGQDDNE